MDKSLAEKIAVMQAAQGGAVIERLDARPNAAWEVVSNHLIVWNWYLNDYRVKPRPPREIYINEYAPRGLASAAFATKSGAEAMGKGGVGFVATRKFVEVLEDGAS